MNTRLRRIIYRAMILVISGILVEVNKTNVKNLRLYVKPDGKVTVSAPLLMGNLEIENFVHSKIDWIKKHITKFKNHPTKSKQSYVNGGTFFLWGKEYKLQIEYGNRSAIKIQGDKAIFMVRQKSKESQREKYVREWYRKQLIPEIEKFLPKWEKKTGLKCESWNTKYMTSRWGSCKIKNRKICFNLQLAKKPPECLEYVILHELIHFKERYHNDRFYSLVSKFMPNWKEIRSLLNAF